MAEGAPTAGDFARRRPSILSRLRVAFTPDFGFAPTERQIAEVFAEKTDLFRHVFAAPEDATPDCSGADEAFEVIRAVTSSPTSERVRTRPQDVGPNVRANVEAACVIRRQTSRAPPLRTTHLRRWQAFFAERDVI